MTPLLIRLDPRHVAKLDELRGEVPRVAFIRARLAEMLDGDGDCAGESWSREDTRAVVTGALRSLNDKLTFLPVGPPEVKPGSRLKKRP